MQIFKKPVLFFIFLFFIVACSNQKGFFITKSSPFSKISVREARNFTYSESQHILGNPTYKIGDPYQIKGQWYKPSVNYKHDETGIASWYGPQFHGRRTANGEIFDKNRLTAAHRTLPLPSIVIVTNLENGRSVKLRVNDRGPFARGRVIDVSERTAEILGFKARGTAPVRVHILSKESKQAAIEAQNWKRQIPKSLTQRRVSGQKFIPIKQRQDTEFRAIVPLQVKNTTEEASVEEKLSLDNVDNALAFESSAQVTGKLAASDLVNAPRAFIQIGAFQKVENVNNAKEKLKNFGYPIDIKSVSNISPLVRVRLGPLGTLDSELVEQLLDQLSDLGFPESHIRIE